MMSCSLPGRTALVGSLLLCLGACGSLGKHPDDAFDDAGKTWQEIAVKLPPTPQAANLLPFDVSAVATQQFALDGKSLSLGTDGVVRYTLVGVSSAGARNVSYEGIRCESREQKTYALGHADGTWSQARNSEWRPIISNAMNRQQAALAQDYFCDGKTVAGNANDMLRRLRRHETLTSDTMR